MGVERVKLRCKKSSMPMYSDGPDADVHHRIGAKLPAHGKWSVRLANRRSQGDFWPAETHRDPRRTVLNFLLLFAITTQWFSPQP